MTKPEIEQLFENNYDCFFANPKSDNILAMTKDKFVEVVSNLVEARVMRFAKPTINNDEFAKWLNDRMFNAECEDVNLDKHLLGNYLDTVEQFINSPESKVTKSVFEIATQTIKKYLEQNV